MGAPCSFRGERLDLGNWVRGLLSRPLPPPTAADREVEVEAEEEGRDAGNRVEVEAGGEEADHLVVMVNGLSGSSSDWKFGAEQFVKRLPRKVYVHRSECNHSTLTFDGVDLMGERLAEEVRQVVQRRRNLRKISFVAHSLGGLISRYAIGKLYEQSIGEESGLNMDKHSDEETMYRGGKLAGLEPMNFITSTTPHLSSRLNKQLPFLFGVPLLERTAAETAHFIVGRTGKHLFLSDRDDEKPPLLVRMVEDCDDGKFMSALRSFKRRVAYANITYDHIVGWRTSSIRRQHELPELQLTANDEKYPHVIHVSTASSEVPQQEDSVDSSVEDSLEGEQMSELLMCKSMEMSVELQVTLNLYMRKSNRPKASFFPLFWAQFCMMLAGAVSLFFLHSGSANSDSLQNDNSLAPAIESAVAIAELRNFPREEIGDSDNRVVPLLIDVMQGAEESSSATEKTKEQVENEEETVANLTRKRTDADCPDGKKRRLS